MWMVVIVVVVVALSIVAGESDSINSGNGEGVDQDERKCEGCRKARRWYDSRPKWKRAAYAGWFAYKKVQCNAGGCGF